MTRGFVTVATGDIHYYKIASELLHSYRFHSKNPLPFAIIAESENEYTAEFDQCLILKETHRSYIDKLEMFDVLPFDINIFIDADCLAYRDLNRLFEIFKDADDFCCFGRVLPLDDRTGWFNYEDIGELQKKVNYIVGLHGGIYYMRKTELCRHIFDSAKEYLDKYEEFHFKGHFKMGDEPLLALSMAVNGMKPIPHDLSAITCYWEYENKMRFDFAVGEAIIIPKQLETDLVHWGTRFTKELLYEKQTAIMHALEKKKGIFIIERKYDFLLLLRRVQELIFRGINKFKRIIKRN